ncbi:MAG: DUF262 domain-containing protein [Bacteroidetes bacterium]|nr:DUF262 domain-containing protein [Bacteroidota bacterium]
MKIKEEKILVREIVDGYEADEETGKIVGYRGNLNIRPPYQRQYIHQENEDFKMALMESVYYHRPINLIYFADKGDGKFELLDGQQRIMTIAGYIRKGLCHIILDGRETFWSSMSDEGRKKIMDYELHVYICKGKHSELMKWFQTINTGAEALSDQELRNSLYPGAWTTSAQYYFTRAGNQQRMCSKYMKGDRERQEHLERIIEWMTGSSKDSEIRKFMALHQHEENADGLWEYFKEVYGWIESLFKTNKLSMHNLNWGDLHRKYGMKTYNPEDTKKKQQELLKDLEVKKKSGIYEYILGGEVQPALLNLRTFDENTKTTIYQQQEGKCAICGEAMAYDDAHADHIKPWSKGGRTEESNCQVVHRRCNQSKGAR